MEVTHRSLPFPPGIEAMTLHDLGMVLRAYLDSNRQSHCRPCSDVPSPRMGVQ